MAEPIKPTPANFKHIVRIANVDLPGAKNTGFALTGIKGVGLNLAHAVCNVAEIAVSHKLGELSERDVEKLNQVLSDPAKFKIPVWMFNRRKDYDSGENKHLLTGTLNFTQDNDLKRLKKIKSYRGIRHIHGQPVRGQRTRSNFRKNKGKVVGVTKKKEPAAAKKETGGKK
ncbi:TPA: 30S ribosomal protein S13 [Candidatus Woesearchaeota archaeon]|nr:30S ribosomal protein S13 [Candidatus Woesearchaeota archaeon]